VSPGLQLLRNQSLCMLFRLCAGLQVFAPGLNTFVLTCGHLARKDLQRHEHALNSPLTAALFSPISAARQGEPAHAVAPGPLHLAPYHHSPASSTHSSRPSTRGRGGQGDGSKAEEGGDRLKGVDEGSTKPELVAGAAEVLFSKWCAAGAGPTRGKNKSVDYKEYMDMLKSLKLHPRKIDTHKAREIFRQVRRTRLRSQTARA
jgi:hypothetical protein